MPQTLETGFLQVAIDSDRVVWNVVPLQADRPVFEHLCGKVEYRCGGRRRRLALIGDVWEQTILSPAGALPGLTCRRADSQDGLQTQLDLVPLPDQPGLAWRIHLHNAGRQAIYIDRLAIVEAGGKEPGRALPDLATPGALGNIRGIQPSHAAFFSNGWQSWSYTGAYHPGSRYRRTRLGPLRAPTDFNHGTPQPWRAGRFAADMFGVLADRTRRTGALFGFLTQRTHFGSLQAHLLPASAVLRVWANGDGARLDPGASLECDWVRCSTSTSILPIRSALTWKRCFRPAARV